MNSNLKALVVVIDAHMFPSVLPKLPKKSSQLNATLFIAIHVSKILDNIPNKSQSLLLVICLESPPGFNFKGLQSYPNSSSSSPSLNVIQKSFPQTRKLFDECFQVCF